VTLTDQLREHGGGLLAAATADADVDFTAAEAIREGELAHYGGARVLVTDDADLALLGGDHLYALGLAELASAGDLEGVETFAALIARCAQAHAENRPEDAAAAWEAL
jgi:hypothetical protein